MAKHVHIFLGPKIRAVTTDSPDWDESKHPRADNGQFGKGSGGGAKPAAKKSPHKNKAGFNQPSPDPKFKPAPIEHATTTGQSFLPKVKMSQASGNHGQLHKSVSQGLRDHLVAEEVGEFKRVAAHLGHPEWNSVPRPDQLAGIDPKKLTEAEDYLYRGKPLPSGTPSPVRAPERTPMRQAMRNQEAAGIKEARRVAKQPPQAGVLKSTAMMQSEATIAEVLERIRGRKKTPPSPSAGQGGSGGSIPVRYVKGYGATAEKSQFGGYRPHVTHPDGSTALLSQHSFETPEQAADYAEYSIMEPGVLSHGWSTTKKPDQFPGYIKPKF